MATTVTITTTDTVDQFTQLKEEVASLRLALVQAGSRPAGIAA